jgi:hypothetical protein
MNKHETVTINLSFYFFLSCKYIYLGRFLGFHQYYKKLTEKICHQKMFKRKQKSNNIYF